MYPINITHYFEATVDAYPDRIAVYEGDFSITFSEIYEQVLQVAAGISNRLAGKTGQIIAVCLPKCIDAVVANLAILYSGNAYMNLDVKNPEHRTRSIVGQTRPVLIIARDGSGPLLPEVKEVSCSLKTIRDLSTGYCRQQVLKLREQCIDTDLLCVINTSGSTGVPKAVALNHRSFIDFTESVCISGLVGDEEVVASLSPLVFDIFSFELCMLMAKGSSLVIVPESFAAFPVRLLELMVTRRVTFIFWVPTIMVNIANMDLLSKIALPDLKMVWFAGEVFPTAKFNYWRNMLPHTTFANFYGPIEITLDCVYYVVNRELLDDEPIPIGKPFRNTSILILNDKDEVASAGEEGELCVRGSSLAMGYYNNPEKTSSSFVQNPINPAYPELIYRTGDIVSYNTQGELVFRGRKDTLIKHMGYRIELTEIEHVVVNVLKLVANCCALYDSVNKIIVLAYEASAPVPEKELRQKIGNELPRYMVPGRYKHLLEMPRNTNGKIDRLTLSQCI